MGAVFRVNHEVSSPLQHWCHSLQRASSDAPIRADDLPPRITLHRDCHSTAVLCFQLLQQVCQLLHVLASMLITALHNAYIPHRPEKQGDNCKDYD